MNASPGLRMRNKTMAVITANTLVMKKEATPTNATRLFIVGSRDAVAGVLK